MTALRKLAALAALGLLIGVAASARPSGLPGAPDLRPVFLALALPVVLAGAGIIAGAPWGRWLGLAGAIGLLPWAIAIVSTPSFGAPRTRPWLVLLAAGTLLISLTGRGAFAAFEGRASIQVWGGRKMALVRWSLITQTAAILNLFVFAIAYSPAAAWQSAVPGSLALALMTGVLLLAWHRTAGLLVLLLAFLLLPPAALYYVFSQPVTGAERGLFLILMTPGWLITGATLCVFAGPALRFSRG